MIPKRLMILGAGVFQLRLIRRARVLGYETHAVSIPGNYPGFAEADFSHYVDTTDVDAVVAIARKLSVKGVVTAGTDACVPAMGAVCDALGLPGISRLIAETISLKDHFRTFQKDCGIPYPRFITATKADAFVEKAEELRFPIVVKPSDASGSRGVCHIKSHEQEIMKLSFEAAIRHSRRGVVCAEELLKGTEVGGNALLWNGRVEFLAVTAKHMDGLIVRGHNYPTNVSKQTEGSIKACLEQCCGRLGYKRGALNFDVMTDGDDVQIIELAARLGGNGLTDLIERAYGYDTETEVIRMAAGDYPHPAEEQCVRSCGSVVFGAPRAGLLRHMPTLDYLQEKCPFVFDMITQRQVGDEVFPMRHNADLIGYVLFDIPKGLTWRDCADALLENIDIQISCVKCQTG